MTRENDLPLTSSESSPSVLAPTPIKRNSKVAFVEPLRSSPRPISWSSRSEPNGSPGPVFSSAGTPSTTASTDASMFASVKQKRTLADPVGALRDPFDVAFSDFTSTTADNQSSPGASEGFTLQSDWDTPRSNRPAISTAGNSPRRSLKSSFAWRRSHDDLDIKVPPAAVKRRSSYFSRRRSTPVGPLPASLDQHRPSLVAPEDAAGGQAMDPNAPSVAPALPRRASMFDLQRHGSRIWQTAYGNPERPGYIRRGSKVVRNVSVSSFKEFSRWTGAPRRRISVFEEDLDLHRQEIIDFIATVKTKNEAAEKRSPWLSRSRLFPPLYILSICVIVYLVIIGYPLWNGFALTYWRYFSKSSHLAAGTIAFVSWAGLQSLLPVMFCRFEQEVDPIEERDASEVALIIPAYKAAALLGATIEHALKIYKKEQIFIIANGNSKTPLDNAAEVCAQYGVNHYWVPIGSKITAEFVGVAVAAKYKYVMLIDDDVHLPVNLPLVTKRFNDVTKCIGYTIKSTGADGVKGTIIQQCQDMEYKSSGLTRDWAGRWGSCTFPHGAIILWEREALQSLFSVHPGFVISEDWYFGHCARQAGYRIRFCSQVFVETETPPCLLWDRSSARGGYGEMTVFKQRFYRWNYFFVYRLKDDLQYLLFNWRLGRRECTAKYQVMIEVVDAVINLFRPFIFVISLVLDYKLTLYFMAGLTFYYVCIFTFVNLVQLRKKNEMVSWKIMPTFFAMKFILLWFGSASMYYGMYDYIRYFRHKHPKVVENHEALEAVYNIRMGVNLAPIADTRAEIIEEVEEVQQAREDQAEITVLDRTPNSSPGDLEQGPTDLRETTEEKLNRSEEGANFSFDIPDSDTRPMPDASEETVGPFLSEDEIAENSRIQLASFDFGFPVSSTPIVLTSSREILQSIPSERTDSSAQNPLP